MDTRKHVLHIDDDQDDLYAFREAVSFLPQDVVLVQQQEAWSALEYLRSLENEADLPDLIIVDLNMPGISGKEFLSIIKKDPVLKQLPVIAFTTSSLLADRDYCESLGVTCITKPSLFDDMIKVAREMLARCA